MLVLCPSFASGTVPTWPNLHLAACPPVAPQQSQPTKVWKHGKAEEQVFLSALAELGAKHYSEAAARFSNFVRDYPDSDYEAAALFGEMAALGYVKDVGGQARVAVQLIELPSAEAMVRVTAFVSLSSIMSVYVRADDPEKVQKLLDLEQWSRCGRDALADELKPPNMTQEAFEEKRQYDQSILDRTDGYVALMRQDYERAQTRLEEANKLNPKDPLTNLWLFETFSLRSTPDFNAGVFYLARVSELAPQATQGGALLKRVYVSLHGSADGLAGLERLAVTNSVPPPGLQVWRAHKQKRHYGSALAAGAITGLLAYGMVRYPWIAEGIANSVSNETASPSKVMIFGGPDHKTYLGCLSCSAVESDSVFNRAGPYGSRVAQDSIWNPVGDFGSPVSEYSACNPTAAEPPVIVDGQGNAYGRLTLNHANPDIGAGVRLYGWLSTAVCRAGSYLPSPY